ncbi:MAG: hypothetical protein Q7T25_07540 [Sideroxyarcus sp.]|nr:hypothetical protein [Sideroxyarcus sp.]
MKHRASRSCVLSIVLLVSAVLPVYGAESSQTLEGDRVPKTQPDDIRLPDRAPIQSPGFPSELTGKCLTMQECLAYCRSHQSEPVCDRFIDKPRDKR